MSKSNGKHRDGVNLSRRGFLKGAGITAAGAAIAESGIEALAEKAHAADLAAGAKVAGPGAVPVKLRINGQDKALNLEPRTTLADALRVNLDLTGTKIVCDRGECSA